MNVRTASAWRRKAAEEDRPRSDATRREAEQREDREDAGDATVDGKEELPALQHGDGACPAEPEAAEPIVGGGRTSAEQRADECAQADERDADARPCARDEPGRPRQERGQHVECRRLHERHLVPWRMPRAASCRAEPVKLRSVARGCVASIAEKGIGDERVMACTSARGA
jgi:hypothetical protein